MQISSTLPEYDKDLLEIARLFYPKFSGLEEGVSIFHTHKEESETSVLHTFIVTDKLGTFTHSKLQNKLDTVVSERKLIQTALYETLSKHTKKTFVWGSLVGIRPIKAVTDLKLKGFSTLGALNHLKNTYYLSQEKCDLILKIMEMQGHRIQNDKLVNLYVNIPFCVSRCSYCSFMSSQISYAKDLVVPYVQALVEEIRHAKALLFKKSFIVKNIYIGGGTPTALEAPELELILRELAPYRVKEFTVEAGRVDTITKEKLDLMKQYGVTRISINPQTFSNKVLKKANRNHTVEEFLEVYKMAMPYGFIINTDLIAGLDGETLASFKKGVDTILELSPENVTVHTLSLKRASFLNQNEVDIFKKNSAEKMLDYAYKKLTQAGYEPYYMYRQKNMLENLENIGFSKKNTACEFNIDSIDEYASILACGAGGASKRITELDNKKEQAFNIKGVKEYIERLDEMKQRKETLFS